MSPDALTLWARARAILDAVIAFTGDAVAVARRWKLERSALAVIGRMVAPAEALARRLVFAEALALTVRVGRRVVRRASPAPAASPSNVTLIPLNPLAFRQQMLGGGGLVTLRVPHPLDAPPERWRVRFCVMQCAERAPRETVGAVLTPKAPRFDTRAWPTNREALLEAPQPSRRERRAAPKVRDPFAHLSPTPAQLRAAAEAEWWMQPGDPVARPAPAVVVAPPKPDEKLSTAAMARRMEALARVIANPARFARRLARLIAKRRVASLRKLADRVLERTACAESAEARPLVEEAVKKREDTS
jgi:hypothetical protein